MASDVVRIGIIGTGAVAHYHHVPGIELDPRAKLTALCDPNKTVLQQRGSDWGVSHLFEDWRQMADCDEVDAVIVATPNDTHHPITMACLEAGKHVMCEKPLGLKASEAWEMYHKAEEKRLKHMTAFTYRFAPSMRYLKHLVESGTLGEPRHFRSQRFLDLPETSWGWRQEKARAGAGDLFDMTIHRIDLGHFLIGQLTAISGAVAQYARRDQHADGSPSKPSEVDDWSALIGLFENGAMGVWEGSTVMKGYTFGGLGYEWAEINGSDASAIYQLSDPNNIQIGGAKQGDLKKHPVPEEFLKPKGSPRDWRDGVASTVFRYDLVYELVSAIVEDRPAEPGFDAGAKAQDVADAVLNSFDTRQWINLSYG